MSHLRRAALTIATGLAAILFVFGLAEIAVRALAIEPLPWPSVEIPGDVPQISVDPLLGPLPRPGYEGDWLQFPAKLDSHGFRATGFPPPSIRRARVAFLGDSSGFGWGVSTPDTFVAQLDQLQRRRGSRLSAVASLAGHERVDEKRPLFELLNGAIPGHTAIVAQYMLAERILPLDPDIVVFAFSANLASTFSLVPDTDRFHYFNLRRLLLRSKLLHILAAKLTTWKGLPIHPRDRDTVLSTPFADLHRVAPPADLEAAQRAMVADARSAGARPVFLLFPRPSQVSTQFKWEDSALAVREEALPPRDGRGLDEKGLKALRARDLRLLENSCLDHRRYEDPIGVMREQIASWQPVRPNDGEVLALLAEGSHNFAAAHYAEAAARFAAALERQPDSPLALYDWGVSLIMAGDRDTGLDSLDRADRLSCNAFLHYNVLTWKIATELNVPVVDLTLFFQTRGNQSLFLDPVHPNVAGHHLIAVALWQTLNRLSPTSPATTKSKG